MHRYTYAPPPIIEDENPNHKFVKKVHKKVANVEDVWCMCVWNDNLACGFANGEIRLYEIETGEYITTLKGHKGIVSQLLVWGASLVSASNDGDLRIWDSSSSQLFEIGTLPDLPAYPFFLCVANTRYLWAHASNSETIQIFNNITLPIKGNRKKEKQGITAMCSIGEFVYTGIDDRYICKWTCDGTPLTSLPVSFEFLDIINWNGSLACTARKEPIRVYSNNLKLKRTIPSSDYLKKFSLVECNTVLAAIGTSPSTSIHFYSHRMVEIDSINASCSALCSWKDLLFVFSGNHIDVWKVKRPSWSSIRLLWIAFFKNQQFVECRIGHLPKDMIRLIAKFVDTP